VFGLAETKAVARMLAKRMREWSEKTGDNVTQQLVDQWQAQW
jgi:hypothetical protein